MELRNAIGIDPDSSGCVCAYVKIGKEKVAFKKYHATDSSMKNFMDWLKKEGNIIVAIEGSNGQSKPIEKSLRQEGVIFYSFKPSDVEKFRKTVLGQNKNNEKDAESVARYAMALESQGKLDQYKRLWYPDEELQGLTRSHEQRSKSVVEEINRLWKLIRAASPDLYLALGGRNPDININNNILSNQSILSLLSKKSDIFEWKRLSEADFSKLMGRDYKGRSELIKELQKVSQVCKPVSFTTSMMIKNSAVHILHLKGQMNEIESMLEKITKYNKNVQALVKHKGIGTLTSSTINAEIIDIRRFVKDGNLASYAGLVKREHSTGFSKSGSNNTMRNNPMYNRRLKNAFMTAAKNFVQYNPDSHLSGYYRNLIKRGMSVTEARKRVARALVRVIFRLLYSLIDKELEGLEEKFGRESDMANGLSQKDLDDPSNISLISGVLYNLDSLTNVKRKLSDI